MGLADIKDFLERGADAIAGGFTGGQQTPVQAQTETVLKRLGFDQSMLDRFGDSLGTRSRRFSDFARDGALAVITGDVEAPLRIRQQVVAQAEKALNRQREIADREEQKRREDNQEMFDIFGRAREYGRNGGNAEYALKVLSKEAGIEMSPLMAKLLADEQQLKDEDFDRIAKALAEGGNLKDIVVNSKLGLEMLQQMQALKADEISAAKDVAELKRTQQENEARELELGLQRSMTPFEYAMARYKQQIIDNPKAFQQLDIDGNALPLTAKRIHRIARAMAKRDGFEPDVGDDDSDPGILEAATGQPVNTNSKGLPQRADLSGTGPLLSPEAEEYFTSQGEPDLEPPGFREAIGIGTRALPQTQRPQRRGLPQQQRYRIESVE